MGELILGADLVSASRSWLVKPLRLDRSCVLRFQECSQFVQCHLLCIVKQRTCRVLSPYFLATGPRPSACGSLVTRQADTQQVMQQKLETISPLIYLWVISIPALLFPLLNQWFILCTLWADVVIVWPWLTTYRCQPLLQPSLLVGKWNFVFIQISENSYWPSWPHSEVISIWFQKRPGPNDWLDTGCWWLLLLLAVQVSLIAWDGNRS